jgi:hypothetical protein
MSIFLQSEISFVAGPFLGIHPWKGGGEIYKQKPYCTECGEMLGDKTFGVVSYVMVWGYSAQESVCIFPPLRLHWINSV